VKRIYKTWDQWECYPAGFYEDHPPAKDLTDEDCIEQYREFLASPLRFRLAAHQMLKAWPNSTEHYLTNERMNRIAWIGQASMCYATGIPSRYRGGYNRLTKDQQQAADTVALDALNEWLLARDETPLTMTGAESLTEMDLY
jgi:hypothetical protein